jgi:acyl-CoA synthetase (AMP-forming)/AMP-acid ligase II
LSRDPLSVPYTPVSYLESNARRAGNREAIRDGQVSPNFSELLETVLRASAELRRLGVGPQSVVGLNLANTWEYVACNLAIPNAGGIVMPLPLTFGSYELGKTLSGSRAVLLISGADSIIPPDLAERVPHLRIIEAGELLGSQASPDPVRAIDRSEIVEISLTSGTTGLPKLAAHSAGQHQAVFQAFTSRLGVRSDDSVLSLSPLTQGVGGMSLHCVRLCVRSVMLHDAKFTAEGTMSVVAAYRPTLLVGVPTNLIRIMESPSFDPAAFASVRATAVAGSLMPAELARRWEETTGSRICIFYGSMDAGHLSMVAPEDPAEKRWHTVGRIQDCCEVQIRGPEGPLRPGEIGEVCMRGETVQAGYWDSGASPYQEDGWAHLGDLGVVDDEGFLRIVGRAKDIIIRGGSNINPYEVEDVLRSHPAVADVCVVGRPDPDLGERAVAFVVPRAHKAFALSELRDFLLSIGLARYKWPEHVIILEDIPLSGPGKVNRRELQDRAERLVV